MSDIQATPKTWSPRKGLDHVRDLKGTTALEEALEIDTFLAQGIRMEPRASEAAIIAKIQGAIAEMIKPTFEQADRVLEEFYESVRIFDIDRATGERTPRRHADGRYVEDWANLSRQDVEAAIWGLQRCILSLETRVSDLYMRTQFAHNVWDDEYQERYRAPVEGTVHDRTASARRATKDSRYYYLFTYWLWKLTADRVRSLTDTRRIIEFHAQRDLRRQR
jgi:hypothetical protein